MFKNSPDRDNTVQGMWWQEQRRSLRRDHVRGLQGIFPSLPVIGGELSVSPNEELRRGSGQPKPVSVLPATEVPQAGHVQRWWVNGPNNSSSLVHFKFAPANVESSFFFFSRSKRTR